MRERGRKVTKRAIGIKKSNNDAKSTIIKGEHFNAGKHDHAQNHTHKE